MMNRLQIGTSIIFALIISACSAPEQDDGQSPLKLEAVVVDGYVMRGLAYIDEKDNKIKDSFETSKANTDSSGRLSKGIDKDGADVNYCETYDSDGKLSEKCFKVVTGQSNPIIRVTGGYNKSIGEEFIGTLSIKLDVSKARSSSSATVISPITSLLVSVEDAAALGTTEELTQAELNSDYLDFSSTLSAEKRLQLVKMALQLHKSTDVIFTTLNGSYSGAFGDEGGLPSDGTPFVYEAIVENLDTGTVDTLLTSDAGQLAVVSSSLTLLNESATNGNVTPVSMSTSDRELVAAKGVTISTFVSNLIAAATLPTDAVAAKAYVNARERAIEVVTALLRVNAATDQPVVDAINAATQNADKDTYLINLENSKFNLVSLVSKFQNGTYLSAADADFSNRAELNLSGSKTFGSDGTNIGLAFNDDGTVELTSALDLGGDLSVDAGLTGTVEEVDEYTSIVTFEPVPGVKQSYVVKSGDTAGSYYMDVDGELKEFTAP
ncbi:MAG: hypothetical protein OEX83_09680 [Gammaproteobacteria bacterium]|nr:hypothetical protein [Gammaproteobacteria bacterium]